MWTTNSSLIYSRIMVLELCLMYIETKSFFLFNLFILFNLWYNSESQRLKNIFCLVCISHSCNKRTSKRSDCWLQMRNIMQINLYSGKLFILMANYLFWSQMHSLSQRWSFRFSESLKNSHSVIVTSNYPSLSFL